VKLAEPKMNDQERAAVGDDKREILDYMKTHRLEEVLNEVRVGRVGWEREH